MVKMTKILYQLGFKFSGSIKRKSGTGNFFFNTTLKEKITVHIILQICIIMISFTDPGKQTHEDLQPSHSVSLFPATISRYIPKWKVELV